MCTDNNNKLHIVRWLTKMKRARESEEFDSLAELSSPSKSVKIHGVLTNLSPIKHGKCNDYF